MENNKIKSLHNIIQKFKTRSDVVDGNAIGWRGGEDKLNHSNRPKNVGSGLTTTGWCVSASEAFNSDNTFNAYLNLHGATSKLVSIDIKEQYHGYCYNGSQNKWHTAILLNLDNINYIVDLTCGQFGNEYVNKNVWVVESWMSKFRSGLCKHKILDFKNNEINVLPTHQHNFERFETLKLNYNLKDYTKLDEVERSMLLNFTTNFADLNDKLILGTIKPADIKVLGDIIEIYKKKMYAEYNINEAFTSLVFNNKEAASNWINKMFRLNVQMDLIDIEFELMQNMLLFESIELAQKHVGVSVAPVFDEENSINMDDKYILNIKFKDVVAYKSILDTPSYLIFLGTKLKTSLGKEFIEKTADNESTLTIYS